jgi:universal stress protein A
MKDLKKILVLTRMTKESRKAVRYGVSLSKKYGCDLSVLHVIHKPFGTDLEGWNLPLPSIDETYEQIVKEEKEELERVVALEREQGMVIKTLLKNGEPTEVTLKTIKEDNIDLLIMPSHSEWRLEHILFGRSNDEIIRNMPCSILLVKEEPGKVA